MSGIRSIRDTVTEAMTSRGYSQYMSYAAPVIEALEARERDIYIGLIKAGSDLGADAQDVSQVLYDLGVTPPVVASLSMPSGDGQALDEDERDQLAAVRHDLAGLMERIDGLLG